MFNPLAPDIDHSWHKECV